MGGLSMGKVSIKVNGVLYEKEIRADLRLIDFIRDELKFKGTKEGCGEGECGACTVILNGKTVNSCLIYANIADGGEVTTIEGLASDELHPIQKAFIDAEAVQCGYCMPGMILSAKWILDRNPNATENEIREGISGNLCRCTGYEKIVQGVLLAKEYMRGKDR